MYRRNVMFEKKNKNGKRGMHNYLEKLRDDGHFLKKKWL